MKYHVAFYFLLLFFFSASAQPLATNERVPTSVGNTYAVIIGISSYLDADIQPLEFSNRDAVFFADFLMSESGGSVPKEQIKLLIDSAATTGEIEKAIRWLKDIAKKNDNVFFYFSGHGALENVTMYNNGYLICHNSPSVAFVSMALSIEYLNDVINTLSVQTNANVIVITDACHSGKMAGSKFKGNYLVGEQLMTAKKKEMRMASCTPDQLSNEKKDWGGGRGVFSYHLVNGLQGGLADTDNNGVVTLGELKHYMETSMANDPVLKNDGEVQTPVIKGDVDFQLSKVVESEAIKIKQQVKEDSVSNAMIFVTMSMNADETLSDPEEYFFSVLKKEDLEGLTGKLKLDSLSAEKIAFALISDIETRPLTPQGSDKLKALEEQLKNDAEKLRRFNITLARAINDKGQDVIVRYIKGDEAELERRRYYNANNNGYDIYPRMFAASLKLSQGDEYLMNSTAVLLHYFKGATLRLKIPVTENPKPLIEQALIEQKKALELEEHAAYIYNELGILYQYKKEYTKAENYFIQATQLSPRWATPQSNLCGLYSANGKYEKATAVCQVADSLQNGLQSVSVNLGFINERMNNQLFAEEYYRNAIEINSRHFLPFERLGYVYMNTANYAMADSFFYEADLRKKGYHFQGNEWELGVEAQAFTPVTFIVCDIDSSILEPTDVFAFFTWGVQEYREKKYANAVRILRKVVTVEMSNPLVYHYLGKIYYDQQKWEEAEVMFKLASKYSKGYDQFVLYVDSVASSKKYKYDHDCFERFFRENFYRQVDDYYFLGTLYETWKHVEEAEKYFKTIIGLDLSVKYNPDGTILIAPNMIDMNGQEKTAAYVKLWQLLEKQGRYDETEAVIKEYGTMSAKQADEELNEFYRRVIDKFPDNGDWVYRLGNLLYQYAPLTARLPYLDSIAWFPLLNKEMFIDTTIYLQLGLSDSLALYDISETGSISKVEINEQKVTIRRTTYLVPGTKEWILSADAIYMPRKDGIAYLQRAAELLSEKETLADIHFKTGNIYLWAGSKKQAYPYFEKSLSLVPDNANARLTLVDIYKALYKNRAAFNQLNYLNDSNQINLPKRILFAQFNIYAGYFDKANESLNKTESYAPYTIFEINNLRGLAGMLANKPKQAIEFYQKSINAQETDPWFNNYSLARLYAKTGNIKEAWKHLQLAIDFGFNYSYVLQNDSYMESLRKTAKWQTMISSISIKKYRSNIVGN